MKKSLFALMLAAMGATSAMAQDVKYFADYTTIYGLAQGRIEISPEAMKHRGSTYKFMYKDGRLDSLVEINSNGQLAYRYEAYKYHYCDNGKIDYIMKSTEKDYVMLDYNDDLSVLTYRNPGDKNSVRLANPPSYLFIDEFASLYVCAKEKYVYDSKGRIIKAEFLDAKDNPTMSAYYVPCIAYKYDDKNRMVEKAFLNYDGSPYARYDSIAVRKYKYNGAGYLEEESTYDEDGKQLRNPDVTYDYDQYGNITKVVWDPNDEVHGIIDYTATSDSKNSKEDKKIAKEYEKIEKDSEKYLKTNKDVYERNSLGCITKASHYKKNKLKSEWRVKYDERGFMTVAENVLLTADFVGEVVSKIEFEYNDKACAPSKVTYYDEKGNVARTELLKYDSRHQRIFED